MKATRTENWVGWRQMRRAIGSLGDSLGPVRVNMAVLARRAS